MKKIIIAIFALSFLCLLATETDDFRFIIALYKDANYKLAKNELDTFIKKYPNSQVTIDAKFLLANVNINLQNYKKSEQLYSWLSKNTNKTAIMADVNFGLAKSKFYLKKYKNAKKLFSGFISKFASHKLAFKAYYYLGKIEYIENNYAKAARYFENAYTLNNDTTILPAMIENLIAFDDFKRTEEVFNIAKKHSKKDDFIYLTFAKYSQSLVNRGKYKKLVNLNPDLVSKNSEFCKEFLTNYAIACIYTDKNEKAIEYFDEINSEKAIYYKALALINLNQNKSALNSLKQLTLTAQNPEIKANAYFFEAKLEQKPENSINKLESFIKNNPNSNLLAAAYYQIAYIRHNLGQYNESLTKLKKAASLQATKLVNEQILFLMAESEFALNNYKMAEFYYNDCLVKHPNGVLAIDAKFKKAVCMFKQKNYKNAKNIFTSFVEGETLSKKGESYYYLAEIKLYNQNYSGAIESYKKAIELIELKDLAYLRIAKIYYIQKKYDDALNELKNIENGSNYAFDKHLLAGNIWFNSKKYKSAKVEFDKASRLAKTEMQTNESLINLARSSYQLKQYKAASRIYKKISKTKKSKGKFLILAANSSFSAEDYISAIDYFRQYLLEYPNGNQKSQAVLGIADSYYNQGNYQKAATKYLQVIYPQNNKQTQVNAINGFKWCAMQNPSIEFVSKIKSILQIAENANNKTTITLLLNTLIDWHFSKNQNQECLINIQHLLALYPNYENKIAVLLKKAQVLVNLLDYEQAERVFNKIYAEQQSAEILYVWHSLKLKQKQEAAALSKLKAACSLENKPEYWLELLKLESKLDNAELSSDYNKFLKFANDVDKQKAKLILAENYIKNHNFASSDELVVALLKSQFESIKADAQYLKGYTYFAKKEYEKAVPELLRVRYLYPNVAHAKLKAELMAFDAYVKLKDFENASKVLDGIKDEIPADKLDKLEKTLAELK